MNKDTRLGDTMPVNRPAKWGAMNAGESHLSDEWHSMEACEPVFSEKWDAQQPSEGHMSDKWVEMEAGTSDFSDRFNDMKQSGRRDPYSMAPSEGERAQGFKEMARERPDNKRERATEHNEFGSTREI